MTAGNARTSYLVYQWSGHSSSLQSDQRHVGPFEISDTSPDSGRGRCEMGHHVSPPSRIKRILFMRLKLILLLIMAGILGHKILGHFRKHSGSSSEPQPQPQQQQLQPQPQVLPQQSQPPFQPQHQPQQQLHPQQQNPVHDVQRSHTWTLNSEVIPLHEGGTYPRLCRLSDGTLLCVVTRVLNGMHILKVSRSTDNGRSFAPYSEITRGPGDVDNGFLLEVPGPQGPTVLAAFRNHSRGPDGKPTHFRITVCRSTDGGKTWHFASQAAEQSAAASGGMGLWEPFIRLTAAGTTTGSGAAVVQLTYSGELAKNDQETFSVDSSDGGATWSSPPRCLRCHARTENLRDGMQGIAKTRDAATGRDALVMVFETTRRRPHFSLEYVVSYDDGRTWGDRGVVYVPRGQKRDAGSPQIAACKGGRLAVVFMTDEDVEQPRWPRNAAIKAVFADGLHDGRIRWSEHPVLVHAAPAHWPGVLCTAATEVMAVYEQHGKPLGRLLHVSD
ncbi:Sialidase [Xylaria cf. heliscus]|nr:Sialidase [Xylaria cf. heliscus]